MALVTVSDLYKYGKRPSLTIEQMFFIITRVSKNDHGQENPAFFFRLLRYSRRSFVPLHLILFRYQKGSKVDLPPLCRLLI
jgi:hypothetical protein